MLGMRDKHVLRINRNYIQKFTISQYYLISICHTDRLEPKNELNGFFIED